MSILTIEAEGSIVPARLFLHSGHGQFSSLFNLPSLSQSSYLQKLEIAEE